MILNSDRLRHDEFGEAYSRVPENERSALAEVTLDMVHSFTNRKLSFSK